MIKQLVKETMYFFGMLGFLPTKASEETARKWLNTVLTQAYQAGKKDGLDRAREIQNEVYDNYR